MFSSSSLFECCGQWLFSCAFHCKHSDKNWHWSEWQQFFWTQCCWTLPGFCSGTGSQRGNCRLAFSAWRNYCNDLQACFLVFWHRNKMSIAALHLPARRKFSCLFWNGKGRCFISIQSRPEMMAALQLLINCTAIVKLAGWRGFLAAVGVILTQIKVSLSLVWLRNGDNTDMLTELVLQLVLLFCLFIYSKQGAVTVCTSQHKHSAQQSDGLARVGTAGAVTVRFGAWLVLLWTAVCQKSEFSSCSSDPLIFLLQ